MSDREEEIAELISAAKSYEVRHAIKQSAEQTKTTFYEAMRRLSEEKVPAAEIDAMYVALLRLCNEMDLRRSDLEQIVHAFVMQGWVPTETRHEQSICVYPKPTEATSESRQASPSLPSAIELDALIAGLESLSHAEHDDLNFAAQAADAIQALRIARDKTAEDALFTIRERESEIERLLTTLLNASTDLTDEIERLRLIEQRAKDMADYRATTGRVARFILTGDNR